MADSFYVDARGRMYRRPANPNIPPSPVETPARGVALTTEERAAIMALPATDQLRAALVAAEAVSVSGGGGSTAPASTAIALDAAGSRAYDPLTITGPTTITISGATKNAQATMVVIANGTNTPTISGADEWASSFGFVPTANIPNRLDVWYDGVARRYAWSQAAVLAPVAAPPAPAPAPTPDTTAPVFGTPAIANATPSKIVIPVTEAVGLSGTLTGAATATVAGSARTVTGAAVVGSTVEVTLASAVTNGQAVVLSAPAGWVRDTAGNQAAALTNVAVTNNVAAAGQTAVPVTLTSQTPALSAPTNEVYTGSGATTDPLVGQVAGKLPAGVTGWIEAQHPNAADASFSLAFDAVAGLTPIASNDFIAGCATNGSFQAGENVATAAITPTFTIGATAGSRMRLYRDGTTGVVTQESTADDGVTWTVRKTFTATSTADLYATIHTVGSRKIYQPRTVGFA